MLNLTSDERKAVLFVAFVFLSGLGINFAIKQLSPQKTISSFLLDLGKINLNTADKKLLMSMPGIGDKLSQRIIDYRVLKNGFNSIEELRGIDGIIDTKFEKIKDLVIVK